MYKTLIQLFLLLILFLIIFFTSKEYFFTENTIKEINISTSFNQEEKITSDEDLDGKNIDNEIINLTYEKFDKDNKTYLIKAKKGILDNDKPNIVNMKIVEASLTYLDNEKLIIYSDEAIFNKQNFQTKFSNNVKLVYQQQGLESDTLEFLIDEDVAIFKDNVRYYNENLEAFGDTIIINLLTKEVDIKSKNQKKIIIKNKN
jgi:lipopolysaccharide export system protein LptA